MMKKIVSILIILLFLMIVCTNLKAIGISDPTEENAGYALLDTVFVTFKELAEMGEGILEKTQKALNQMMKDARKARAQNQIDDVFFKRFHRILVVLNIVITPVEKDDANIMGPYYFGELNRFIEDILGEKYDVQKAAGHEAIDKMSQAISQEITNLRLYLDSKKRQGSDPKARIVEASGVLFGTSATKETLVDNLSQILDVVVTLTSSSQYEDEIRQKIDVAKNLIKNQSLFNDKARQYLSLAYRMISNGQKYQKPDELDEFVTPSEAQRKALNYAKNLIAKSLSELESGDQQKAAKSLLELVLMVITPVSG
jgi:hypothetical protein